MAQAEKQYTVTGLYVTVKTMTTDGWRVVGLHAGALMPPDVPQSDLDHLLRKGLIAEVGKEPLTPADLGAKATAEYAAAMVASREQDIKDAHERLAEAREVKANADKVLADAEAKQAATEKLKAEAAAPPPAPAAKAAPAKTPAKGG